MLLFLPFAARTIIKMTFFCSHGPTCYCSISLLPFAAKALEGIVQAASPESCFHSPQPSLNPSTALSLLPPWSAVTSMWLQRKLTACPQLMGVCPTPLSWLPVVARAPWCSLACGHVSPGWASFVPPSPPPCVFPPCKDGSDAGLGPSQTQDDLT